MKLKTITPPSTEPLTLIEAKQYLKAAEEDDITILSLIKQAREYCEDYQSKKYIAQTLEAYLDQFPCGSIEFRDCSPVQSITSIKYISCDGEENTFDDTNYSLDDVSFVNKIDLAYEKTWPSITLKQTNGIKIQFVAGYGNAEDVPESIKWAMVLHMKVLYDDYKPDERARLEKARDSLLGMRRVIPV